MSIEKVTTLENQSTYFFDLVVVADSRGCTSGGTREPTTARTNLAFCPRTRTTRSYPPHPEATERHICLILKLIN